jgi:hypothetical protein
MIEDIRNSKNLKIYLEQMEEVKARLEFISNYSNPERDRFVIETHALQIRKLIELLAFSLMAIHQTKYKGFREKVGQDYTKDWNGRDIITNLLKINPDMFFRASEKQPLILDDGTKQIQLKPEKECYTLKRMAKLYDRCGGVLHVANPWKESNKIDSFHHELPSIIEKLNNTLLNHIVLVNHWDEKESTAVLFTLCDNGEKPTYALAEAPGNFSFINA